MPRFTYTQQGAFQLAQGLRGLSSTFSQMGQMQTQNELNEKMRLMMEDLQTFSLNYEQQKNVKNNKYFAPGTQYVGGDGAQFNSDWYSYSLATGNSTVDQGDDIILDYGEKLWNEKFAGQFSSERSEQMFRQMYNNQMSSFQGSMRAKNFNYQQQAAMNEIDTELGFVKQNPNNLSVDQAMQLAEPIINKGFEGGLYDEAQANLLRGQTQYSLVTGETWKIAEQMAVAQNDDGTLDQQGVMDAKRFIYSRNELEDKTKDELWARLDNQHKVNLEAEKNAIDQQTEKTMNILQSQVLGGQIVTKDQLRNVTSDINFKGEYTGTFHRFPDSYTRLLEGWIDEDKEGGRRNQKYDTGNYNFMENEVSFMMQQGDSYDKIVNTILGAADAFRQGREDVVTLSNTEANDLIEFAQKNAPMYGVLSTDERYQAQKETYLIQLKEDNPEISEAEAKQYEYAYDREAARIGGGTGGSLDNEGYVTLQERMDAYKDNVQLEAVSKLQIGERGGFLFFGGVDPAEEFFREAEAGRVYIDTEVTGRAIKENWTEAEWQAYRDQSLPAGEIYDTLVNNMQRAQEISGLVVENFPEQFDTDVQSVQMEPGTGIPFVVDTRNDWFKLEYDEDNKTLDYQYAKPVSTSLKRSTINQFDNSNVGKNGTNVFYTNEGTGQVVVQAEDNSFYTVRGVEDGVKRWIEVQNISDILWTEWNEEEKKSLDRFHRDEAERNAQYTPFPY